MDPFEVRKTVNNKIHSDVLTFLSNLGCDLQHQKDGHFYTVAGYSLLINFTN